VLQSLPPTELRASRDLHLRILDAVEDRQYTETPGRSRLLALGAIGLMVVIAALVQAQRTRTQALAASVPTVTDVAPGAESPSTAAGRGDPLADGSARARGLSSEQSSRAAGCWLCRWPRLAGQ